jgi:hypothetical protein
MARGVVVVSRLKGWKDAAYRLSPDELKTLNKQGADVAASVGGKPVGKYWRHAPGGRLGVWLASFPSVEKWEEYYAKVWSAKQAPGCYRHAMYWDMEFEVWYERED